GLPALPSAAAQLVERRVVGFRTVARQKLDILHRQEEPVVAGIVDFETFMRRACRLDGSEADEPADAMIRVNDDVAGSKRTCFRNEIRGFTLFLRAANEPVAQNVLLR